MPVLPTVSDPVKPVVCIDRFSYGYPGAEHYTLRDISLQIAPGECHLLEGPTGSGKSTLIKAIRGLLPQGHQVGTIAINTVGNENPGLVQQNPRTQLLCSSLGADIAFGLENHCVAPGEMVARVEEALVRTGLHRPLSFPVDSLSMGQQYRACLAGQLVLYPNLLLLDEPVAQLDPHGRQKTLEIIRQFKNSGGSLLICEHRPAVLEDVIDCRWQLENDGRLSPAAPKQPVQEETISCQKRFWSKPARSDTIVEIQQPKFNDSYGELDLASLKLTVKKGECVVITGPNGSGKTTLLRSIAGLVAPESGKVEVFGATPKLSGLRGRVAVLFQDPTKQLFESTVFDDVSFAARRNNFTGKEVGEEVGFILKELGIDQLAQVSPHGLSYGQKHLVGLATVLAGGPEVLLLDDPFAGLDQKNVHLVMALVGRIAKEKEMAVIWTSHDPKDLVCWADRIVDISTRVENEAGEEEVIAPSTVDTTHKIASRKYRLPAGFMLVFCMVLSILAFAARRIELLVALGAVDLGLLLLCSREVLATLRKSAVLLFWQASFIILLYLFRFGFAEGLAAGSQVGIQLFLAFWPGMIFMSACSQPSIVRAISKFIPDRAAFVMGTCLRFLPMLLSEMQQIREVQILRGAKILVRDLRRPRNWPDWFHCLLIPTLIKTMVLADEIAGAASARDFGIYPLRTNWPGD